MTLLRLTKLALSLSAVSLSTAAHRAPLARLAEVPLAFEPNQGQAGPGFQLLARTPGYSLYVNPAEAVMVLAAPSRNREAVVRMRLAGATQDPAFPRSTAILPSSPTSPPSS